jgi:hypothetical protein
MKSTKEKEREVYFAVKKFRIEAEMRAAKMAEEYKAKHKKEIEELKRQLSAEDQPLRDMCNEVQIISCTDGTWDHMDALKGSDLRVNSNPAQEASARRHAIHWTLLWTPPALASINEMYDKLKLKGWKPIWKRASSKFLCLFDRIYNDIS